MKHQGRAVCDIAVRVLDLSVKSAADLMSDERRYEVLIRASTVGHGRVELAMSYPDASDLADQLGRVLSHMGVPDE